MPTDKYYAATPISFNRNFGNIYVGFKNQPTRKTNYTLSKTLWIKPINAIVGPLRTSYHRSNLLHRTLRSLSLSLSLVIKLSANDVRPADPPRQHLNVVRAHRQRCRSKSPLIVPGAFYHPDWPEIGACRALQRHSAHRLLRSSIV